VLALRLPMPRMDETQRLHAATLPLWQLLPPGMLASFFRSLVFCCAAERTQALPQRV
jgi:hypothetical protein